MSCLHLGTTNKCLTESQVVSLSLWYFRDLLLLVLELFSVSVGPPNFLLSQERLTGLGGSLSIWPGFGRACALTPLTVGSAWGLPWGWGFESRASIYLSSQAHCKYYLVTCVGLKFLHHQSECYSRGLTHLLINMLSIILIIHLFWVVALCLGTFYGLVCHLQPDKLGITTLLFADLETESQRDMKRVKQLAFAMRQSRAPS